MAANTPEKTKLVKEFVKKYPTHPNLTLARLIYKKHPSSFKSIDNVRSTIRVIKGQHGTKLRKSIKDKALFAEPGKLNPFDLPESHANDYTPYIINQSRTLIISDLHFPYQDNKAIELALNYGLKKNVNCILINGDLLDMPNHSRFEKDWRMRSTFEEFEAVRQFLKSLRKAFPKAKIVFKEGNHCFDTETEILTKDGWKKHNEISYSDQFATFKAETREVEYHNPEKIHRLDYDGKMLKVQTRSIDMLVTEGHRLYVKYGGKNAKCGNFNVVKASDLNTSSPRVSFMSAGMVNNPEYNEITDDEIRICAWIHTDGSIFKTENQKPKYVLYQRLSKVKMITDILISLGYDYSLKTRDRLVSSICGKELKKRNDKSCTIIIKRGRNRNDNNHRLDEIIEEKYTLPQWVHKLSQRQFDIFLNSLIDGDGSRHINSTNSSMIYGIKGFLDQVHAHLAVRGYRSSMTEYRKNTFRLNILHSRDHVDIDNFKENNEWVDYKGKVFCVTVPNGLVIVRRNGKVHVSGNCERWERWLYVKAPEIFDDPEFKLDVRLRLGELKIDHVKDKRIIKIGKLSVLHGHEMFGGSGGVNPARSTFLKTMASVIVGHYHKTSSHVETAMNGEVISVHSVGCLCGLSPLYAPINKHNLGFAYVEMDIKTGDYHIENLKVIKGKVF
jgi:hypothetical protein